MGENGNSNKKRMKQCLQMFRTQAFQWTIVIFMCTRYISKEWYDNFTLQTKNKQYTSNCIFKKLVDLGWIIFTFLSFSREHVNFQKFFKGCTGWIAKNIGLITVLMYILILQKYFESWPYWTMFVNARTWEVEEGWF